MDECKHCRRFARPLHRLMFRAFLAVRFSLFVSGDLCFVRSKTWLMFIDDAWVLCYVSLPWIVAIGDHWISLVVVEWRWFALRYRKEGRSRAHFSTVCFSYHFNVMGNLVILIGSLPKWTKSEWSISLTSPSWASFHSTLIENSLKHTNNVNQVTALS